MHDGPSMTDFVTVEIDDLNMDQITAHQVSFLHLSMTIANYMEKNNTYVVDHDQSLCLMPGSTHNYPVTLGLTVEELPKISEVHEV